MRFLIYSSIFIHIIVIFKKKPKLSLHYICIFLRLNGLLNMLFALGK